MAFDEIITRLKSQLLTSGLSQKDQPLFQIINQLIDYVGKNAKDLASALGGSSGGGSVGLINGDYITHENNIFTLPNSRQLVAGSGISLLKTPTKIVISASGFPLSIEYDEPEIPLMIPGPQGIQGSVGVMGPPGIDGECYCEPLLPIGTTLIG